MKNPPFSYERPETLHEALTLLASEGEDAKILAGGQSLLPILSLRLGRPEILIDISRVPELGSIGLTPEGLVVGAMVSQASALRSPHVSQHAPLLHAALPHIGHRAIRTRGTIGGSVAHADPAAELPAVCLASDITLTITSLRGTRAVSPQGFFQGYMTTALEPDELLAALTIPPLPPTSGWSIVEESRRGGDFAMVGVATIVNVIGGLIESVSLSYFGLAATPIRVSAAENALVGAEPTPAAYDIAASIVSSMVDPSSDIHATANYRRHLAGVLTKRSLREAVARIGVTQ